MTHTVRVYFKRTGEFPYVWSFDRGHIRSQKVVKDWHPSKTCDVSGGTDFISNIENSPKVFVKVKCNRYTVKDGELYLS